jgi:hypothetical protein
MAVHAGFLSTVPVVLREWLKPTNLVTGKTIASPVNGMRYRRYKPGGNPGVMRIVTIHTS